jgi:hypothetical protein
MRVIPAEVMKEYCQPSTGIYEFKIWTFGLSFIAP